MCTQLSKECTTVYACVNIKMYNRYIPHSWRESESFHYLFDMLICFQDED